MIRDDIFSPMSPHQIARFIRWLEWQADRHYEQRLELRKSGRFDIAFGVKLEAHTYERVRTAFLEVLSGHMPGTCPSRD